MGLSNAEKNRRKRERKKRQKEEERQRQLKLEAESKSEAKEKEGDEADVEIEYVAEELPSVAIEITTDEKSPEGGDADYSSNSISEMLRRFHERSTVLVSDDEGKKEDDGEGGQADSNYEDDEDEVVISNKKLRLMNRPTIAELKNRVERADLVEAHDVTSADPEFLLYLKALPGTVPVPRHWGRKRKYLQGKVCIYRLRTSFL